MGKDQGNINENKVIFRVSTRKQNKQNQKKKNVAPTMLQPLLQINTVHSNGLVFVRYAFAILLAFFLFSFAFGLSSFFRVHTHLSV